MSGRKLISFLIKIKNQDHIMVTLLKEKKQYLIRTEYEHVGDKIKETNHEIDRNLVSRIYYDLEAAEFDEIENVDNELDEVFKYKLKPSQAILIGQRDLDKPEIDFIRKNEISIYDDINKIENDRKNIIEQLKEISSDNLYLHIDLDVLDNIDFPEVLVPVEGGIKSNQLIGLIEDLRKEFTIVGMGLVEYTGSDISNNSIIQYLLSIGSHLSE